MMVWLLFIIGLMGLFFYNKIGSIISIGDLPTTNIIEPVKYYRAVLYQLLTLGIVQSREEAQNLIRQSELLKSYSVEDLDDVETSQQFFKSLVEKEE